MTAKEMFEELGYTYFDTREDLVEVYPKTNLIYQFYKNKDEVLFYVVNANKNDISFNDKELQAINKQCEEFGLE